MPAPAPGFSYTHSLAGLVPRPRFPTTADGLHQPYVESGSGTFFVLWILECYAIFVSSHKWGVILCRHILINRLSR